MDAAAAHLLAGAVIGCAGDANGPRLRLALSGEDLDQLALAVAGDPGDPQDLAAAHGERDAVAGGDAFVVESGEVAHLESHLAGLARFPGGGGEDRAAAEHHRREVRLLEL